MYSSSKYVVLCLLLFQACVLHAELFPDAHELFRPLQADPRELQYLLRMVVPQKRNSVGEVAGGDYLGIYRWPTAQGAIQLNAGGGVFGRFNVAVKSNDAQVIDFYGNMALDYRQDRWSSRLLAYHTSSHLGDDYVKSRHATVEKHTFDNMKSLVSYEFTPVTRLYGGYTYVFKSIPRKNRHAVQAGAEFSYRCGGPWELFWGNDWQVWGRTQWSGMYHGQVGIRLFRQPDAKRSVSLFGEYSAGSMPYGQFFEKKEVYGGLGLKFQMT